MSLSLYEKVSLNFGSGVVAVAIVGTLAYVSLGKLAVAARNVGDTQAVLEHVDLVRQRTTSTDAALKDYLLMGDAATRDRLERAASAAVREMSLLRGMSGLEGETRPRADSGATLLATYLAEVDRVADVRARAGIDSARTAVREESFLDVRDQLDALLGAMRDDQRVRFGARSREQAASATDAAVLLAVGLLVSFIAAALALSNIRRYLAHRRKLELQRTAVLEREQAARTAAEEANRAKTDFLRMMSHELRTPLTAIQGYLELLEMGIYGQMTEEQVSILRRIESNERHLLGIINDLLDFARVDARRVELRIAPLPLRDIRLAVDPLCRPHIDAKQLSYTWRTADDHWLVRADREKVRQIVVNLVTNACKFTPRGGAIDVDCVSHDRSVELRVRDTGPGIPPHKLEAIFEPFVQLDNGLTRSVPGTGLGLAISRELARAMGGDLTVASAVGEGSIFALRLPRGDVDSELLPESATGTLWGATG